MPILDRNNIAPNTNKMSEILKFQTKFN